MMIAFLCWILALLADEMAIVRSLQWRDQPAKPRRPLKLDVAQLQRLEALDFCLGCALQESRWSRSTFVPPGVQ